jgi:hypothetical protein
MTRYSVVIDMECEADPQSFIPQLLEKLWVINRAQWYSIKAVHMIRISDASFGKENPETKQWSGKDTG